MDRKQKEIHESSRRELPERYDYLYSPEFKKKQEQLEKEYGESMLSLHHVHNPQLTSQLIQAAKRLSKIRHPEMNPPIPVLPVMNTEQPEKEYGESMAAMRRVHNPELTSEVNQLAKRLSKIRHTEMNPSMPVLPVMNTEYRMSEKKETVYLLQGDVDDTIMYQKLVCALFFSLTKNTEEDFNGSMSKMALYAFSCYFKALTEADFVQKLSKGGCVVKLMPFREAVDEFVSSFPALFKFTENEISTFPKRGRDVISKVLFSLFTMALAKRITEDNLTWAENRINLLCGTGGVWLRKYQLDPRCQRFFPMLVYMYYPMTRKMVVSLLSNKSGFDAALENAIISHMEYAGMTNLMLTIKNLLETNIIDHLRRWVFLDMPDLRRALRRIQDFPGDNLKFATLLYPERETKWANTESIKKLGCIARIVGFYRSDRRIETILPMFEDKDLVGRIYHTLDAAYGKVSGPQWPFTARQRPQEDKWFTNF